MDFAKQIGKLTASQGKSLCICSILTVPSQDTSLIVLSLKSSNLVESIKKPLGVGSTSGSGEKRQGAIQVNKANLSKFLTSLFILAWLQQSFFWLLEWALLENSLMRSQFQI